MKTSLLVSVISGLVVFALSYWHNYRQLLYKQPGVATTDVTSFPPSSAWLVALPQAIGTLIVVFVVLYFFLKLMQK